MSEEIRMQAEQDESADIDKHDGGSDYGYLR